MLNKFLETKQMDLFTQDIRKENTALFRVPLRLINKDEIEVLTESIKNELLDCKEQMDKIDSSNIRNVCFMYHLGVHF